jgi:hypothetical protein
MSNLTLASRLARAVAVLACVLVQWWPVATYAGPSPPTEIAFYGPDEAQGDSCRPFRRLGTVTTLRFDCAA